MTDVALGASADDQLYEIGCPFDPRVHHVVEYSPWVSNMRYKTRCQDLNMYRHKQTGNWMLFVWWVKPTATTQGIMMEIYQLPFYPDQPSQKSREKAEGEHIPDEGELLKRLGSYKEVAERMEKHNRKIAEAKAAKAEADHNYRLELAQTLRRWGAEGLAWRTEKGFVPLAAPDNMKGDVFRRDFEVPSVLTG